MARELDSGRYAHRAERACVCGHSLSMHTAAAVAGSRPCIAGDLGGSDCDCECFKPARARARRRATTTDGGNDGSL
jgi:hypothetical protein